MSTLRDLRRLVQQFAHLPPETEVFVYLSGPGSSLRRAFSEIEVESRPGHRDVLVLLGENE